MAERLRFIGTGGVGLTLYHVWTGSDLIGTVRSQRPSEWFCRPTAEVDWLGPFKTRREAGHAIVTASGRTQE